LDLLHSLHKNLLILSKAKQQADCKALSKPLIVVLLLSRQTLADTLLAFLQHEGYSLADLGYNCSK
jgi:hypothetical protein